MRSSSSYKQAPTMSKSWLYKFSMLAFSFRVYVLPSCPNNTPSVISTSNGRTNPSLAALGGMKLLFSAVVNFTLIIAVLLSWSLRSASVSCNVFPDSV